MKDRVRRSDEHLEAAAEYEAIRKLRNKNWIAAHIREERYERGMSELDVADAAGTSASLISKLEADEHVPTIPELKRILAVFGEDLLIGIERRVAHEEPEREIAPAPDFISG